MCFDAPEAPKTDPRQIMLAEQQGEMSKEMFEYTKERDKLNDARAKELQEKYLDPYMDRQMEAAKKATDRADEMYEYSKQVGRPALQRMFDEANNYDSEDSMQKVRSTAFNDAEMAFSNNMSALNRNTARLGVNPASGRYAEAQGDVAAQLALAKITAAANATSGMRKDAMNARVTVGGIANGFGNQSIQFSNSSSALGSAGIGAGQTSFGNNLQTQSAFTGGLGAASGVAASAGNAYGNIFNQDMASAKFAAENSTGAALGQLAGMGANMASAYMAGGMKSDRRVKTDIKRVGTTDSGVPIYTFKYVWDKHTTHMGVMAQEVSATNPQAVSVGGDGVLRVDYSLVG